MTPVLISIEAFRTPTAERKFVYVGSAASPAALGLDGKNWHPNISTRPIMSLELMSPDLNGRVQAGTCRFALDLNGLTDEDGRSVYSASVKWMGAPVEVFLPTNLSLSSTPAFKGRVSDRRIDLERGILSITATVSIEFLEGNLLTAEFNGDNGSGGEPEVRGTLKPAGFGPCENIPPVWFDTGRWIGMIDGYGNTVSIDKLMEGLADRGAAVADYADYNALAGAIDAGDVAPGRWATCVAEGLIGLGAPPEYPITVNATFGSDRIGAIIQRVLTTHLGVSAGDIDASAFTALDAAVDRQVRYWTASQRPAQDLIESLAASANATPLIRFDGLVSITRAVESASVLTLNRDGNTLPRVTDWETGTRGGLPWRIAAKVAKPASTLAFDEVLYEDDIIDRGLYDNLVVYRQGNVVWSADKSSWLYINATPDEGNAPPTWPTTSNTHWQNLTPPVTAADIGVEEGATAGAQTGVNLTDAGDQILTDSDIGNVNVTIGADGTLAGAGGGQVTIVGLGYVGELDATAGDNLIQNGEFRDPDTSMFGVLDANVSVVNLTTDDPAARGIRFAQAGNGTLTFGQGASSGVASFDGRLIAATAGQKIYFAFLARKNTDTASSAQIRMGFSLFANDGDYGGVEVSGYATLTYDAWEWHTGHLEVDEFTTDGKRTAIIRPYLQKVGTTAEVDVAAIILSRTEIGADITANDPKLITIDPGARGSENLVADHRFTEDILRTSNSPTLFTDEDINYIRLNTGATNFITDTSGASGDENNVPIVPGKTYQCSIELRSDGERPRIRVRPRGSVNGSPVNLYDPGGAGLDTAGQWQEFTYPFTVPIGAHSNMEFGIDLVDLAGGTFCEARLPRVSEIEPGATDGATIGDNLQGTGGVVSEPDILNVQVTIGADGTLVGAGGGQVTIGGLGYLGDLDATLGATWGNNVLSIPTNLAGLVGTEGVDNSLITVSSDGTLNGAGGGQITAEGLGVDSDGGWGAIMENIGETATITSNSYERTGGNFGNVGIALAQSRCRSGILFMNFDYTAGDSQRTRIGFYDDTKVYDGTNQVEADMIAGIRLDDTSDRVMFFKSGAAVEGFNSYIDVGATAGTCAIAFDGKRIDCYVNGTLEFTGEIDEQYEGRFLRLGVYTEQPNRVHHSKIAAQLSQASVLWEFARGLGTPSDFATSNTRLITLGNVEASGSNIKLNAANINFSATDYARTIPFRGGMRIAMRLQNVGDRQYMIMEELAQLGNDFRYGVRIEPNGDVLARGPDSAFNQATGHTAVDGDIIECIYDGVDIWVNVNGVEIWRDATGMPADLTLVGIWTSARNDSLAAPGVWTFIECDWGPYTDQAWGTIGNGPSNVFGLVGTEPIDNLAITIAADGTISGAGGGQVTIGGLGYTGALDATNNIGTLADLNAVDLSDLGLTSGLLPTTRAVGGLINTGVSIASDGTLSGGGGGQVTLPGLGGESGADVTKSIEGSSTINFDYDSDGVIKSGQTGNRGVFSLVTSANVTITSGVTWAVTVVSGSYQGASPTMVGTGTAQIDFGTEAVTAGKVRITATYLGRTYTKSVDTTISQDPPPTGGGGGGGSTNVTGTASGNITTSWSTLFEATVSTDSGVTEVTLTANMHFIWPLLPEVDGIAGNIQYQWQRETSVGSGTFNDVGAVADSAPDPFFFDEGGFPSGAGGNISCTRTDTGRTASTEFNYRLRARISSGTLTSASATGGAVQLNGE